MLPNVQAAVLRLLALLPALTLHEFAHAYSAYKCGDPTPQMHGRVTLNPLAHLDPIGTLAILFLPIGWAKPVPINPANFRHPSRDIITTSAAGPLSNVAQGIFWALVIRALALFYPAALTGGSLLGGFLALMVVLNLILALFNLIPLGVLDGHHILEHALPYELASKYRRFNSRYGMFALLLLILLSFVGDVNILYYVVFAPASFVGSLASGTHLWSLIAQAGIFR